LGLNFPRTESVLPPAQGSNLRFARTNKMMMMIACISIKSGLSPLIESLYAQILHFTIEITGGLRSHLLLFFVERKNLLKEKSS